MAHDPINSPSHYTALGAKCPHCGGAIEPIVFTELLSFCLGSAAKYIFRCDFKGRAIEDLKKARWYIDRDLSRREARDTEPPTE